MASINRDFIFILKKGEHKMGLKLNPNKSMIDKNGVILNPGDKVWVTDEGRGTVLNTKNYSKIQGYIKVRLDSHRNLQSELFYYAYVAKQR